MPVDEYGLVGANDFGLEIGVSCFVDLAHLIYLSSCDHGMPVAVVEWNELVGFDRS